MVVYIIVFILGSIHLKQSLLELIQNNRWLDLYLCPSSHWKITLCLYSLKQINLKYSYMYSMNISEYASPCHKYNEVKDVLYMTVCYNLVIRNRHYHCYCRGEAKPSLVEAKRWWPEDNIIRSERLMSFIVYKKKIIPYASNGEYDVLFTIKSNINSTCSKWTSFSK